jgi:hypothetical protein
MPTPEEIAAQSSANGQSASGNGNATDYKELYEATQAKLSLSDAEWQKRHGNLQTTFQTEQAAHKLAVSELTNMKMQYEQTSKGFESLTAEKDNLMSQLTEKEAALAKKEVALARKELIMEKFPSLIPFEVNKLLPDGTIEELPDRFAKFSESLNTIEQMAKQNYQAGGTPPPPSPKDSSARTAAMALKDANSAAMRGDQTSYSTFYKEYLELSSKKQ